MQISLLNGVRNHPDRPDPLPKMYADFINDAVPAEELGFVRSWYREHHFRLCQRTGSPMPLVNGAAGRLTELALQMRQPGMTNEETHYCLFADQVMPALIEGSA